MIAIIGDRGKRRRYDPNLAEKVNKEVKEEYKKILEIICRGYEEFMNHIDDNTNFDSAAAEITDKIKPTKAEILGFSRKLIEYKDLYEFSNFRVMTSGYLTALMQSSKNNEFTIDLTELSREGFFLDFIGNGLRNKRLTVEGDVGYCVGHYAEDSEIVVNGNAEFRVGEKARNSKITVNGDIKDNNGACAEGSEIYVTGKIGSLREDIGEGTEIYQKNARGGWNLVYPK